MMLPMLAQQTEITSLTDYILDDKWVFEQKLDGHRLLLVSPGGDYPPTALTRNGTPYTRKLPKALQDFRFPDGEWAIDGELVDGTFYVFDLPRTPAFPAGSFGHDNAELFLRRTVLETFLANHPNPFKLVPQAKTKDQKIKLAETALTNNFEGLVLKKADSVYVWGGRGPSWLKAKFVTTADVVVTDVRDDGKDSVKLGLYENGVLKEVGRASLIGKEKKGLIAKGDTIEVRYLYVGAGGRLYQPTIVGKRDDKRADECTTGQLKFVNKAVLEAI